MKKILSLAILLMAIVGFSSCGDDEIIPDVKKGKYAFVDPCMKWGISEGELRAYMKGMSEWSESSEQVVDNRIDYVNKKTQAEISYTFRESKLEESEVTYFNCNDKFQQMKGDWALKLGVIWQMNQAFGHTFYTATCPARKCKANVQENTNAGIAIMTATFEHDPSL